MHEKWVAYLREDPETAKIIDEYKVNIIGIYFHVYTEYFKTLLIIYEFYIGGNKHISSYGYSDISNLEEVNEERFRDILNMFRYELKKKIKSIPDVSSRIT